MKHGLVTLHNNHWVIQCEPHVKTRLLRVFPKVYQGAGGETNLSATPENTRELEWFLQRYPMTVINQGDMQRLSAQHQATEQTIAHLLAHRVPPTAISMALPPRDYQAFATPLLYARQGLLVADELGLGKTVTAMCPMTEEKNLPAVVVCPAHMPGQWAAFFTRFLPQLKVHIIKTSKTYDLIKPPGKRQADLWPDRIPDVIIVSYHKLRGWADTLSEFTRYVVFDECQQMRNKDSDIYRACEVMGHKVPLRMGLSATPIMNYGNEFHHLISCLLPDVIGTYAEFCRDWCGAGADGKERLKDPEAFGAYLRREGIMLRRTRREVGREIPALSKIAHTIHADTDVLAKLTGDAIGLARIILAHSQDYRGQKRNAAAEFDMLMRQATGIAKAPYVAEFVRLLVESGEKVVLFGFHRAVYDIWKDRLKDLKPAFYTGSEDSNAKQQSLKDFIEGDSQVLVMSLRSGAGVDGLQHVCSVAVVGELEWSPGIIDQCLGRLARDGQLNPCLAYYMLSSEGSDPFMADILGIKREQIDGVIDPDSALVERIDTGENSIRQMAQALLKSKGIKIPDIAPKSAKEKEADPLLEAAA